MPSGLLAVVTWVVLTASSMRTLAMCYGNGRSARSERLERFAECPCTSAMRLQWLQRWWALLHRSTPWCSHAIRLAMATLWNPKKIRGPEVPTTTWAHGGKRLQPCNQQAHKGSTTQPFLTPPSTRKSSTVAIRWESLLSRSLRKGFLHLLPLPYPHTEASEAPGVMLSF